MVVVVLQLSMQFGNNDNKQSSNFFPMNVVERPQGFGERFSLPTHY